SRMFTGGIPEFAANGQRVTVDQSRSFIERVSAFPSNVEVVAMQTFTPQPAPAIPGLPPGFPGAGTPAATTELYHYSLVKLPEQPMMSRLHDERVGYFRTNQLDFGSREQRVAERTLVNRWRLECSEQKAGALCVPKKPITYYVDPNTPTWLVPWVKRGIEEWQPAFEAAGFSKGIVAAEAPANNPDFSGDDASVSMVRWIPSTIENAVGPSIVDPRTGEILDADVQMLHNIMKLQTSWYFTQVGHLDPRVHKLPMPDSLMGRLVQFVVAHEVGHTLGFPHNMKGSSMYPMDSVRSASWVRKMGHSPSIMDYARFNYVAQPEDRIPVADLVPRVGPYDVYAVKWGYSPIPGAKAPEDEKATLDAWARMQDTIPWYRFAADNGIGGPVPGETNEAVGDADAVRATELGIRNLKRVLKLVEPATTWRAGEDFSDLRELYGEVIGQWGLEIGHVARIIGGTEKQEKSTSQQGAVFTPVTKERQKTAMAFLQANAFETPTWLLDASILSKIEAQGSVDRVVNVQRRVLGQVVDNGRMTRMLEQEALGANTYTLAEMLADLRAGLWKELASGATIDMYRRRLQRNYLEAMAAKINPPPAPAVPAIPGLVLFGAPATSADARGLLRLEMKELDGQLAAALARVQDRTTRAHLEDARAMIEEMLETKN
ncbi:MAG: zinc-dependent metalloprotease, partial [Gemmatimonadaceae bacterium]|nr:zinc-dependent metalloprotease [Gemmatimonadaceae bacterium]